VNRRGLQPRWMKNKSASADVVVAVRQDREYTAEEKNACSIDAMKNGGICEACQ